MKKSMWSRFKASFHSKASPIALALCLMGAPLGMSRASDLTVVGNINCSGWGYFTSHIASSNYILTTNALYGYYLVIGTSGTGTYGLYAGDIGTGLVATGANSLAVGQNIVSTSFCSTVIGQYNNSVLESDGSTTGNSTTTWNNKDPLFIVANGTSTVPNNAFSVYKDGTVTMSKAQGDVSMGQFGN